VILEIQPFSFTFFPDDFLLPGTDTGYQAPSCYLCMTDGDICEMSRLFSALATLEFLIALLGSSLEVLGIGIVMAALFLRDRGTREKVWNDESTTERFLGSVRYRKK